MQSWPDWKKRKTWKSTGPHSRNITFCQTLSTNIWQDRQVWFFKQLFSDDWIKLVWQLQKVWVYWEQFTFPSCWLQRNYSLMSRTHAGICIDMNSIITWNGNYLLLRDPVYRIQKYSKYDRTSTLPPHMVREVCKHLVTSATWWNSLPTLCTRLVWIDCQCTENE